MAGSFPHAAFLILAALSVNISVVEASNCVDLSSYEFPRVLKKDEARSAVCQVGSRLSHAFISFRTVWDHEDGLQDCADADYVKCLAGWRPDICTPEFQNKAAIQFLDSGCMAVSRQVENEYQLRACVFDKLYHHLIATNLLQHMFARVAVRLVRVNPNFLGYLYQAGWLRHPASRLQDVVDDPGLHAFASRVLELLFESTAFDLFGLMTEQNVFRSDYVIQFSKYASTFSAKDEILSKIRTKYRDTISIASHAWPYYEQYASLKGKKKSLMLLSEVALADIIERTFEDGMPLAYWARTPSSFMKFLRSTDAFEAFFGPLIQLMMWDTSAGFILQCIESSPPDESQNMLDAIRCMPTMLPAVGYYGFLSSEPVVTGKGRCELLTDTAGSFSGRRDKFLLNHPAIMRRAVEELMPYFQPRHIDVVDGLKTFLKDRLQRYSGVALIQRKDVPATCYDTSVKGNCWLFTRCVRKLSNSIRNELLAADKKGPKSSSTDSQTASSAESSIPAPLGVQVSVSVSNKDEESDPEIIVENPGHREEESSDVENLPFEDAADPDAKHLTPPPAPAMDDVKMPPAREVPVIRAGDTIDEAEDEGSGTGLQNLSIDDESSVEV